MDFGVIELDEPTREFWSEVRGWLDEHVTGAMIEAWRAGGEHDAVFHRALGAKGWVAPGLPVEEGGAGLGALESRILELELARRHVPLATWGTTLLVLPVIRQWMGEPGRSDLISRAAGGQVCFCLGYTEPEAGSDLSSVRTRARREGDGWVISGQKMFTTGAQHCDFCFLLARTHPDAPTRSALTTFLVPLDAPGVEIQAVATLSGERTNVVFYDDVRVGDDHRLGPEGQGWAIVHGPLDVEHRMTENGTHPVEEEEGEAGTGRATDITSYMMGVHEPVVRSVLDWARTPDPGKGRAIDDPLLRQRLARVELRLAAARVTPGPQGRVLSAEMIIQNTAELLDLLGPRGLLSHGVPGSVADGFVEYAHRFAQGTAIYGGTTEVFRNLIAQRFLGLTGRRRPSPDGAGRRSELV